MDKSKSKKLQEIGYKINRCCGLCKYAILSLDGWGTCVNHTYQHEKHTGEERDLSINQFGYCTSFELEESKVIGLHSYSDLIK